MTDIRRVLAPGDRVPDFPIRDSIPEQCRCHRRSADCSRMRRIIGGGGRMSLTIPNDGCPIHVGQSRGMKDILKDYCEDRDPLPSAEEACQALDIKSERWVELALADLQRDLTRKTV